MAAIGACGADQGGGPSPPVTTPTTAASPGGTSVAPPPPAATAPTPAATEPVTVGAAVLAAEDFARFRGQRVAVITNQASMVGDEPLLDRLARSATVELVAAFGPEHGVRGGEPAGAAIADSVDEATGVPVYSLYGRRRAPPIEALADVDLLLFDLQDVGARVYTYISTMGLAMQSAAAADVAFVVLDRPNPLGGLALEGYLRDDEHQSFVGQYPIPLVHGLTTGELAMAIQGERWISGLDGLRLTVVEMQGWDRRDRWADLGLEWVAPSPSLPGPETVEVYPGTVLFEATALSVGRGTAEPFTTIGAPWVDSSQVVAELNERGLAGVRFEPVVFVPEASEAVPTPPYEGRQVPGVRIVVEDADRFRPVETGIHLLVVFRAHAEARGVEGLISDPALFDLLAGTTTLRLGLESGAPAGDLVDGWAAEVAAFDTLRRHYLLYD